MFGFGKKKVADNVLKVVTAMRMLFSYLLTTLNSSDATRASNNRYISKSKKQAVHVNQIDN